MSQKHFKDDPLIGKCFLIDDPDPTIAGGWEVTDAWVDIGEDDDAPRNYSLDRYDGEHDHGPLYYSAAQLATLPRWSPYVDGHFD